MTKWFAISILVVLYFAKPIHSQETEYRYIDVQEYKDKVYASWLGQIIGNTYGLSYEFRYIDEPGPDNFPYGYGWTLDMVRKYNGAFSDDDTDIEYMYLTQMENWSIEPTYAQLRDAWMSHVKERVWAANRQALTLMHAGHFPPVTGSKALNSQWSQIDPQLVNEIWAFTAPGMINYAVEKSRFAAKITNDDFGIEPTLVYAAMYSAAFFETDINKLIEIGQNVLPEDAHFYKAIERVKELHALYPEDWQSARQGIKEDYYDSATHNPYAWLPIDATLNGALGILALLYGEGDIQKTLDYSCAFGMDADNQAATMVGLVAITTGLEGIPENLLYPLDDREWEKPFNDRYKMITRDVLTDASLTDLAERMSVQGERIITNRGGSIVQRDGKPHYMVPVNAKFVPPFEFNMRDTFHVDVNMEFEYPLYVGGPDFVIVQITEADNDDLKIEGDTLKAKFEEPGEYSYTLFSRYDDEFYERKVTFFVHKEIESASLSGYYIDDTTIITLGDKDNLLNNDDIYSTGTSPLTYDSTKVERFGYRYAGLKQINAISLNTGLISEFLGWFTSFDVKYRNENGEMVSVENLKTSPNMNLDNNQWLKPHFMTYWITFDEVNASEIAIEAKVGGIRPDNIPPNQPYVYQVSLSELKVYSK